MEATVVSTIQTQLLDRRERLTAALSESPTARDYAQLLQLIDGALKRIEHSSFGRCEACHESVEDEDLRAHPLLEYCLCDLTAAQQEALQRDLNLATRVQWAALPPPEMSFAGWDMHYRYLPAGWVSGDFCDAVAHDGASPRLAFTVGDVSGHGVAAAFLMARLASMFRTLVDLDAPLHDVVAKANALFTQSAPSPFFATLVAGRASADGTVNVCNAGHLSPLVMRGREVMEIESSGLPVGIAGAEQYATSTAMLRRGDTLVLYTDGVTEAQSGAGELYGAERLADVLRGNAAQPPRPLAAAVLRDVVAFRGDAAVDDDVTLMILRRSR